MQLETHNVTQRLNIPMDVMDTIMELYEMFYQAARHPERVQFAYEPMIPLFKKLCQRTSSPLTAYQMLLMAWDQAIEDNAREQGYEH